MKLQDPTAPYADVIARRRRQRVASGGECFRLGGQAPGAQPRPSTGPIALLGASGWALREEQLERTSAYLGALGGLLADCGYDVFAITSEPDLDAAPAFVGWVGGEETPGELAQLAAFEAPGLSLSPGVAQVHTWSTIEPVVQPTSTEFIRAVLDEIRRLTESVPESSAGRSETEPSGGANRRPSGH